MKLSLKEFVAALTGVALIGLSAGVALADDISNRIDDSIDAVAEVMPLNAGGANGTTELYVKPQNDDGKNGCNLTGSTSLGLSVSSSNTSAATVSPSSVTFTSCGDVKTLTVTPHSQGSATITASQSSNNTGATFSFAPVTFTVNVAPPPNTAPSIQINGVSPGGSYDKGSVPAAICQVTDAEDGNSSFPATLSAITGAYASDGIGSQAASCSYTDGRGLRAEASVTYSIIDPSAPAISYVLSPPSPDGNNGWYKSNVTLTWIISESESPNSLVRTGCVDQNVISNQALTTYSCSATSAGGSAGPESVSIKRDATPPAITFDGQTPAANANGWNNTAAKLNWSCGADLSGVDSTSSVVEATLPSEGANQSATGSCVDQAGNSASDTQTGIDIDLTNPTITFEGQTPTANANGWNNSAVALNWNCMDDLSSVDSSKSVLEASLSSEGANQSATGSCVDQAGNIESDEQTGIDIDLTAPSISLVGGPANGVSYYFGSAPSAPTCNASDALSGLDGSCSVSGYSNAVGEHTVTASASDKAGNSASASVTYTVLRWSLSGFYQPVDMNGVYNIVRGGSTVPLKFEVFAGTELTSTSVVKSFVQTNIACNAGSTIDEVEVTTTGGTSLRYDATAGQFIQNWQTPKQPGQCYKVTMTTQDGSSLSANFKLK